MILFANPVGQVWHWLKTGYVVPVTCNKYLQITSSMKHDFPLSITFGVW